MKQRRILRIMSKSAGMQNTTEIVLPNRASILKELLRWLKTKTDLRLVVELESGSVKYPIVKKLVTVSKDVVGGIVIICTFYDHRDAKTRSKTYIGRYSIEDVMGLTMKIVDEYNIDLESE